jgi:hypothetical protein
MARRVTTGPGAHIAVGAAGFGDHKPRVTVEEMMHSGSGRVRDVVTVTFGFRWRLPVGRSYRLARRAREINRARGR